MDVAEAPRALSVRHAPDLAVEVMDEPDVAVEVEPEVDVPRVCAPAERLARRDALLLRIALERDVTRRRRRTVSGSG